jgi:hypothetical protein
MLPDVLYFDGIKYEKPFPLPQLWMHKEDRDTDLWNFGARPCAVGGCPAVFVLNEPNLKTKLDKHWQYYLIAMNHNMTLENISLLLHFQLAFANGTGVGDDSDPRRDYILERNLNAVDSRGNPAYPSLDKDRTCSRNVLSGIEMGDSLMVKTFNGNEPPPMKVGKNLPATRAEINIDNYLYNPKDHPWMFVVANTVTYKSGNQTSVAPFPRGAQYSWTGNNSLYSFLPLISRESIIYDKNYLTKVTTIPSPYRIV